MAKALASSSSRNFWNIVKNINRPCSSRPSHAPIVDGIFGDSNIANVFSNILSYSLAFCLLPVNLPVTVFLTTSVACD